MDKVLQIATGVGTPLALLGLMAALGFYAYSRWLKHKEKTLEQLSPEDRAKFISQDLGNYGVTLKTLSPEEQAKLVQQEMQARKEELERKHKRAMYFATVFAILFG